MTQETNERELRFEDRMRDADALAWSIEKDPMLRSTIIAVLQGAAKIAWVKMPCNSRIRNSYRRIFCWNEKEPLWFALRWRV